jgi:hypothetical protein
MASKPSHWYREYAAEANLSEATLNIVYQDLTGNVKRRKQRLCNVLATTEAMKHLNFADACAFRNNETPRIIPRMYEEKGDEPTTVNS